MTYSQGLMTLAGVMIILASAFGPKFLKWRKRRRRLAALRRLSPQEFAELARKIQPAYEAAIKRGLESKAGVDNDS